MANFFYGNLKKTANNLFMNKFIYIINNELDLLQIIFHNLLLIN